MNSSNTNIIYIFKNKWKILLLPQFHHISTLNVIYIKHIVLHHYKYPMDIKYIFIFIINKIYKN